jgi:hypothetical protein
LRTGEFPTLPDGIGDFAGFAQAYSDATPLITHHNQRAEIEPTATLDDFGRAVDKDNLLDQVLTFPVTALAGFGSRSAPPRTTTPALVLLVRLVLMRVLRLLLRLLRSKLSRFARLLAAFCLVLFSHNIVLHS